MEIGSWSRMREEGFVLSKGRTKNFGIDLEDIYKSTMLHLER
jgi:hypothetical protein